MNFLVTFARKYTILIYIISTKQLQYMLYSTPLRSVYSKSDFYILCIPVKKVANMKMWIGGGNIKLSSPPSSHTSHWQDGVCLFKLIFKFKHQWSLMQIVPQWKIRSYYSLRNSILSRVGNSEAFQIGTANNFFWKIGSF